ncbi:MAG: single-stranded DNA-binding protein [Bacteroidetes bacterium]|nr:single-stranded DNA-binding protein [Bacteroidota bacterium]MBU1115089.1 single-stranded DNA-binding protein [Bacteroidota bacterium]MBU1796756.1 single-stranded DNA-binding protein [Bacteroidota bacterium]
MAFSLNKAQLIGTIGRDAETSFTTTNLSVTKFSVATSHSRKTKDGNWENETTWHNITAFGLNDFLKDKLKKGAKIYVEGRIDHNSYEKDGQTKYFTSIITDFNGIIPLDKKDDSYDSSQSGSFTESAPAPSSSANTEDDLPF